MKFTCQDARVWRKLSEVWNIKDNHQGYFSVRFQTSDVFCATNLVHVKCRRFVLLSPVASCFALCGFNFISRYQVLLQSEFVSIRTVFWTWSGAEHRFLSSHMQNKVQSCFTDVDASARLGVCNRGTESDTSCWKDKFDHRKWLCSFYCCRSLPLWFCGAPLSRSLCINEKPENPLTDLVLTSAPALTTSAAMSSLPCLAAQCRAVCGKPGQKLNPVPPLGSVLITVASSRAEPGQLLIGRGEGRGPSCAQRGVGGGREGGREGWWEGGMDRWFPAI